MNRFLRQLTVFAGALRDGGLANVRRLFAEKRHNQSEARRYRSWLETKGRITNADREKMRLAIGALSHRPLISIILPVYNVDEKWLRKCIASVLGQIYPHWELCISDDASTVEYIRPLITAYAERDDRIKIIFRAENGHISAASNSALELATGEFTVLLDHDDELSPDALFWIANEIDSFPETAMIYSDEDLIDESGRRYAPKFKPDFSRDLFYSTNLVTHLSGYKTELLRKIGGFRLGFEGSQDYDLALRFIEQIDEDQIRHIPRILYHWRVIKGSVAFAMDEKPYAHQRARDAIREHLERTGFVADVHEAPRHLHRVRYHIPAPAPSISVIVSTENDMSLPGSFGRDRYQIIRLDRSAADRAQRLNEAAKEASGDVLVFLDNSLFTNDEEAIDDLVSFAMQKHIGAVGGRILGSDLYVEQAGIVLNRDLVPAFAHAGYPHQAPGNISRNILIGNSAAVSLSCLAVSRQVFESAGGFDQSMPDALIDVDLCLRLRELNLRIVVVPDVEFIRQGTRRVNRMSEGELALFLQRWSKYIDNDPFCNPNLKRDGSFEIDV